jgi:hypothetical protein
MKEKKGRLAIAVLALIIISVAMGGCGSKEVGYDTLEQAMTVAKENAAWNAQKWRQENPTFGDLGIMSRGDSSQTNKCPQGDGWATVDMLNKQTNATAFQLKCSTSSAARGCWLAKEFPTKPFSDQEGHCQPVDVVPHPLPNIRPK